ncbi:MULTISPECIES: adenosine deaminase [unclassified Undibacterium]|uniref:adenosine deaminase n=1 Tax=unclassified Undibacterium TaxID=2630295 RepID=UPI002AC8A18D|nr:MULTISPECIES: adenosine deaminase [unclassified Undibacterium]MEB0140787.1 adenosine deaminase [Undibacterium sp. CCC2.1]MEB0173761.1 adenosine deaminase [Undibacterium sp. CCC1.1]MEB0177762.1 adenosine deaminase [Undibacterium sp. CCC3.4]MEB0216962.1 adenosine deaminase [Undibacterium sp. 5I2]WPX44686.1 adenosine deaminase [Undibacterium sp. CCC3.4]
MTNPLHQFIRGLPKAELHLHIEGSLEPEMMFALALKNGVTLPYADVEAVRAAYDFADLQSFLDLYYAGAAVLLTEEDFFDLTTAYIVRARADNVRHVELFFDPQTHTERGVAIATVFAGIARALRVAKQEHGFSGSMILCFLRHLSEAQAQTTLIAALPLRAAYADVWTGIGLDSSELGHPPEKFARVFAQARQQGLRLVAHAGEEGPPAYIHAALDVLQVERIDHGVRASEDLALMDTLRQRRMPLTVCPLSNLKLCVVADLRDHNLAMMLRDGICVTINSDDPAYFGGYMNNNFIAAADALQLTRSELLELARNGFEAAFVSEQQKQVWFDELHAYAGNH